MKCLGEFPARIHQAAAEHEPSLIASYLVELSTVANRFYNAHRVVGEIPSVAKSRAALVCGMTSVLKSGLQLLGIKAPEEM